MPKYLVPVDLTKQELQNARVQNLASAPSAPVVGQIYFDTVIGHLLVWNGATWETLVGSGSVVTTVSVSSPITNSGTSTAPNIGIQAAGASQNGFFSSGDYTVFHAATDANTLSAIVKRDGSGNFA